MHDGCTFQLKASLAAAKLSKCGQARSRLSVLVQVFSTAVERKPLRTGGWSTSAQEFRAAHEVNELPPQLTLKNPIHRIHDMPRNPCG